MVPNILTQIVEKKRPLVNDAKAAIPQRELARRCADAAPTRGFMASLQLPGTRIIAEAKKASPSKGLIAPDFDVQTITRNYQAHGAAACSILTEENYFLGSLDYLRLARQTVDLPLLRKDFIFDPYQLFEARDAGADAVLLIAAMLEQHQLEDLYAQARELSLDVLGEAHDALEVQRLLAAGVRVIGVNARDLKTFHTDLSRVRDLLALVPEDHVAVAESAITSKADMAAVGAKCFLIGESLMRAPQKLEELLQ